jgi:hypothetical protein
MKSVRKTALTRKEVLDEVQSAIDALRNGYSEADGKVHEPSILKGIERLKVAKRIVRFGWKS